MPISSRTTALTASLLLGLASTATALPAPQSPADPHAQANPIQNTTTSPQLTAINDAVEATKENPEATCFVVALPETYTEARAIRDHWTNANKYFNNSTNPVFFVRGEDAEFVLDNAFITTSPAVIAYRHGRPYHSRTGTFTQKNLHAFLALALDNSAPTTNAPSQTEYLYNSMNDIAMAGQQAPAAQGACQIMLNLHALIHGPYASTYSNQDITAMTTLYNQSQLTLASFDINDQSVLDQINASRAIAMKTWNKRTNSTFGIGIWFDLALVTGNDSEILAWIDQGLENPAQYKRIERSLADYGQPLAQLLIDTHRYEALAMTINSPDQIQTQLAQATKLADEIDAIASSSNTTASSRQLINSATEEAAASHAALLVAGRDREAWQVAQFTQDFAGPQLASAALCAAAINAAVLSDHHTALTKNLDPSTHASLINTMNTSFAVVPTDD